MACLVGFARLPGAAGLAAAARSLLVDASPSDCKVMATTVVAMLSAHAGFGCGRKRQHLEKFLTKCHDSVEGCKACYSEHSVNAWRGCVRTDIRVAPFL